jgi:hypothetical protein
LPWNALEDFVFPDLPFPDLLLLLFEKMGSHTGFFVGVYVGFRVVPKSRINDGSLDIVGLVEGFNVGLMVG